MKDRRFQFGAVVTAIWLGVMVGIVVVGTKPERLNEWGDFFAGFFAPLAFLWLVIGYLQQGDELRQSSQALRLQAEELRNSVEQQSHLVEVSRKQLDVQVNAIAEERRLRLAAQLPILGLAFEGTTGASFLLRITNTGGPIWRLYVNMKYEAEPNEPTSIQFDGLAKEHSIRLNIDKTRLGVLMLHAAFAVQDGSLGVQHVRIVVEQNGLSFPHLMTEGLVTNA